MDSSYRALMRRKLLEDIYDKMSDEEKRLFVELTIHDADHREIMSALRGLGEQADANKYSFAKDLLANVSGNFVSDGIIWLGSKLLRGIRI